MEGLYVWSKLLAAGCWLLVAVLFLAGRGCNVMVVDDGKQGSRARLAIAGLERAMRPALRPLLLATEIHLHTTDTPQYIFAHSEPAWRTYYRYTYFAPRFCRTLSSSSSYLKKPTPVLARDYLTSTIV